MKDFSGLSPKIVWSIFSEILRVPRPSKHEDKIRKWLKSFAASNGIQCRVDASGNVVMNVPASDGCEDRTPIVLQSHMDMVCEKDADVEHDFMNDPIEAYLDDDGWVKAKGTTLGADCGIGMAIQLALLTDHSYPHPALEAIFTYDEEQGLSGAMAFEGSDINAGYMINLDSEDEGEIFIGCAGGVDTLIDFDIKQKHAPGSVFWYDIRISGLKGGHSGDDIEKGRASAVKLLGRILYSLIPYKVCVSSIDGGNLRNAIARDASCTIAVPEESAEECMSCIAKIAEQIKAEYHLTDPDVAVTANTAEPSKTVYERDVMNRIITSIHSAHHGVYSMSFSMPGLVETSTNLASIKMKDKGIQIVTSQRSSVESAKHDIASVVEANFLLAGARVTHSDGYPGWNPNPEGYLVKTANAVYKKMFGKQPKVRAIHAGLECGLFVDKVPGLQAISVGPTLRGVHSPSERLDSSTVELVWKYLVALISELK